MILDSSYYTNKAHIMFDHNYIFKEEIISAGFKTI